MYLPALSSPWQAEGGGDAEQCLWSFLNCLLLPAARDNGSEQAGDPQRMGKKSPQWEAENCPWTVSPGASMEEKVVKYAREIPEPRRNKNLLLNETVFQEKKEKRKTASFFILSGKTTKPQIGTMEVKYRWNEKHSLVMLSAFPLPLFRGSYCTGATRRSNHSIFHLFGVSSFCKLEKKSQLMDKQKNPGKSFNKTVKFYGHNYKFIYYQ